MKSTFKLSDGGRITVEAVHATQQVWVEKFFNPARGIESRSFLVPADLAGVVAQAIELAGHAALNGPCGNRPKASALKLPSDDFDYTPWQFGAGA